MNDFSSRETDPHGDPTPPRRAGRLLGCMAAFMLAAIAGGALFLTDLPNRGLAWLREFVGSAPAEPRVVEKIIEVPVFPDGQPAELPDGVVRYKRMEVASLFNGITIESELQSEPGDLASAERRSPDAYKALFKVRIRVPEASKSIDQLASLNPNLPRLLPDLPAMAKSAEVSGFYYRLYELKQAQIQANLTRLESVLSRHNFYDCETMLELTHPDSGRRALLMQAEMDVVSDGSDGDRMPKLERAIASTDNYQATTSYGWKKQTDQQNPVIPLLEAQLEKHKERYKVRGLTRSENAFLEERIAAVPKTIEDLRHRSYLIASADPFVVIPRSIRSYSEHSDFLPSIGDYAVVIHDQTLYPAIVGDYGPSTKVGEASLRIAKTISDSASPYSRPVSDLTVTYLFFPGTAERPFGPPNLERWRARCAELLAELGGAGPSASLHTWEDILKPAEEPDDTGTADGPTPSADLETRAE